MTLFTLTGKIAIQDSNKTVRTDCIEGRLRSSRAADVWRIDVVRYFDDHSELMHELSPWQAVLVKSSAIKAEQQLK